MERWKDIPGFEGRYQASTLGRIRSIWSPVRPAGSIVYLRIKPDRGGRPYVNLYYGKSQCVKELVGRLVLLTFVGPCPEKQECRHLNDIKMDNRLNNLKWGTRRQNVQDGWRNGVMRSPFVKGYTPHNKGKSASHETRQKQSIAQRNRFARERQAV